MNTPKSSSSLKVGAREQYLTSASTYLIPLIEAAGFKMPANVRYACGFPSKGGLGKKKMVRGQCWDASCSADDTFEILISPTQDDVITVLAILLHEMIHAAVGLKHGHKGDFLKCALKCGLVKPITTSLAGEELAGKLKAIADRLGAYPHAKLEGRENSGPPKQGTRLLKAECPGCGCIIRITAKWVDEIGLPTCACGTDFTLED